MRWMYEGVDFEPGGKDHASPTGSYQTSRRISKLVYGYEAPVFQGYEFIGIKGLTGKMSGSSGLNLTPDAMLKLYEPEVILWLYSKTEPTKAFDFCFDDSFIGFFYVRKWKNEFYHITTHSLSYSNIIFAIRNNDPLVCQRFEWVCRLCINCIVLISITLSK